MRIPDLAELIARWRNDAETLRRLGASDAVAAILDLAANEVALSAEEWLTWLTEADALMRSGHRAPWLRSRREGWKRDGHARQVSARKWLYRACIIPRRGNAVSAAALGREDARRSRRLAA